MAARASSDFRLQMSGTNLQFGNVTIPFIKTARYCFLHDWINNAIVICQSQMGPLYEAKLVLKLKTAEKVQEFMKLYVSQLTGTVAAPSMRSIAPSERGVTIDFFNNEAYKNFVSSFLPAFFPDEDFEQRDIVTSPDVTRCVVVCKKEGDQTERVKQALDLMESRVSEHVVHELLAKNGDSRFPGKTYPKERECIVGLEHVAQYERCFDVDPDGTVTHVSWSTRGAGRFEDPSSMDEFADWIGGEPESASVSLSDSSGLEKKAEAKA